MPEGSLTCEHCGTYLGKYASSAGKETGVRAIRQGRVSASAPTLKSDGADGRMREYGDYDLSGVPLEPEGRSQLNRPVARYREDVGSSRPTTRRGVPMQGRGRAPAIRSAGGRVHSVHRSHVNWMLIGVICVLAVMALGVGYMMYMKRSEGGQRATARRNALSANEAMFALAAETRDPLVQPEREALLKDWGGISPQAYWLAGQEYLDVGDVSAAITCFRIGDIVDPENYDGLLLLAGAYELNGEDGARRGIVSAFDNRYQPLPQRGIYGADSHVSKPGSWARSGRNDAHCV